MKSEEDYFTEKFGIHSVHQQIIWLVMTAHLYFETQKKPKVLSQLKGLWENEYDELRNW